MILLRPPPVSRKRPVQIYGLLNSLITFRVNQKSIQSQELMRQLEQIRLVHEPLRRNYSQLRNQFRAVQQRLIEVQSRNDRLNVLYRELAVSKCFVG